MMIPGINIPGDAYGAEAARLESLGARWARPVLHSEIDLSPTIADYRARGISVCGVVARESLGGAVLSAKWSHAAWLRSLGTPTMNLPEIETAPLTLSYRDAAQFYAERYAGKLAVIQVGNESDHHSPSSWWLEPDELNALLSEFDQAFADSGTIVLGPGLVSGDPTWARGVGKFAVHPYGQRPWGEASDWAWLPGNFGRVTDLLDAYQAEVKDGLPLWVTEYGLSTTEVSPEHQAYYIDEMVRVFKDRPDIADAETDADHPAALLFCLGDWMVPEFGLFDADGRAKPAAAAYALAAGVVDPPPLPPLPPLPPEPPQPKPPEPPMPEPVTIPEQSYRAWWTAVRPGAEYTHAFDIETYWRGHIGELGPTLDDREFSDGGYQWRTFQSGALRWSAEHGVELVLKP